MRYREWSIRLIFIDRTPNALAWGVCQKPDAQLALRKYREQYKHSYLHNCKNCKLTLIKVTVNKKNIISDDDSFPDFNTDNKPFKPTAKVARKIFKIPMEYVLAKLFLEQKEMSEAEVMENVRTYYECLLEMCGLEPDMNLNSNNWYRYGNSL